jgi:hypothetical protein
MFDTALVAIDSALCRIAGPFSYAIQNSTQCANIRQSVREIIAKTASQKTRLGVYTSWARAQKSRH